MTRPDRADACPSCRRSRPRAGRPPPWRSGRRIIGVTVPTTRSCSRASRRRGSAARSSGRRVHAVRRHGKHFWLELDRRPWLSVHFGMAGGLHTSRRRSVRLCRAGRRAETGWPPRFTRAPPAASTTAASSPSPTAVGWAGSDSAGIRQREPPIAGLGFDALRGLPGAARFRALARSRAAPGQGAPARPVLRGGRRELDRRRGALPGARSPRAARPARCPTRAGPAARAAPRGRPRARWPVGADSERYPARVALPPPLGRRPGVTVRGDAIRRETIAGRTTAWVPAVQR